MNKVLSHHTSSFSKVPRTNSRHTEFLSGPWSCIVYFYCQAFYLACISFWNVLWFFSSHGYLLLAIHSQCHLLRDNFSDDPIQKSWGHSSNCANSPPVLISICHDSWFFNDFFFFAILTSQKVNFMRIGPRLSNSLQYPWGLLHSSGGVMRSQ